MSRPSRIALRAPGRDDRLAPVEREVRQEARVVDEFLVGSSELPR
ncbi:MAG: hypothetical protein ABI699_08310 [Caldimonas sp.]